MFKQFFFQLQVWKMVPELEKLEYHLRDSQPNLKLLSLIQPLQYFNCFISLLKLHLRQIGPRSILWYGFLNKFMQLVWLKRKPELLEKLFYIWSTLLQKLINDIFQKMSFS